MSVLRFEDVTYRYPHASEPALRAVALDVAATLEVRGYATPTAGRPRRLREPWSRHDIAFATAAAGLVALAGGARLLEIAAFDAYPRTVVAGGEGAWLLALAIVAVALLPFADRRGIVR